MPIEAGQVLLHYRIVEKLGEGGMGVVWRAVDTTLDREVAIKALPDAFAADADRLARFEQEARLLASLNHPNIAAVYSVHQHDGARYLAMELVEGEDLSQRLRRGRIAADEAMKIALQVAEALETAHDSGVIHRDLKPANIQLTPAGKIKVLDFGLAKAFSPEAASGDPSLSPTMTSAGTMAGMIIGTAGYMSPEQARGREVDRRADVWAFGCVLFEMLTSRRAFDGETISDTLASVLKVDPEWDALPKDTPPAVRRLLRRCLTRDADARLSHIAGARLPLRETLDGEVESDGPVVSHDVIAPTSPWKRLLPWALVLLMTAVAVGALMQATPRNSSTAETELLTLSASFPDGYSIPYDQMGVMALSPDGKAIALVLEKDGAKSLYVRRLNDSSFVPLPGTESVASPFFSPDGRWIGFIANDKVKKISVDGGNPMTLADADGNNRGASWGAGDRIVFAPHYTTALMQVGGSGGEATPLTTLDLERGERTHRWPHAVPGEDVVLFTVGAMDSPESYDQSDIDAVRPSSGERSTILRGASMARYVSTGHLIFAREGFLFAIPFDIKTLETNGTAVPVVENVMGMRSSGVVHAGIASNGLLAYISGTPRSRESRLVWRHRDGRSDPVPAAVAGYVSPHLSPDHKRIAVGVEGDSTFDIWTYDIERDTLTRLTFEGDNNWPVWSPDGKRVAFASVRDGALMSAYVKAADGSGTEERIFTPEGRPSWGQVSPSDWSTDGRHLLLEFTNENGVNVLVVDLDDGEEQILMETPAIEAAPSVSPDGRWMSYTSDESGGTETYVRPFLGSGGKWQISTDGGNYPLWSPDGRKIFYRKQANLMEVDVDIRGDSFQASRPRLVLDGFPSLTTDIDYDVLDQDTFVVVELSGDETTPQAVTVVVNWLDELRRRVPN